MTSPRPGMNNGEGDPAPVHDTPSVLPHCTHLSTTRHLCSVSSSLESKRWSRGGEDCRVGEASWRRWHLSQGLKEKLSESRQVSSPQQASTWEAGGGKGRGQRGGLWVAGVSLGPSEPGSWGEGPTSTLITTLHR